MGPVVKGWFVSEAAICWYHRKWKPLNEFGVTSWKNSFLLLLNQGFLKKLRFPVKTQPRASVLRKCSKSLLINLLPMPCGWISGCTDTGLMSHQPSSVLHIFMGDKAMRPTIFPFCSAIEDSMILLSLLYWSMIMSWHCGKLAWKWFLWRDNSLFFGLMFHLWLI